MIVAIMVARWEEEDVVMTIGVARTIKMAMHSNAGSMTIIMIIISMMVVVTMLAITEELGGTVIAMMDAATTASVEWMNVVVNMNMMAIMDIGTIKAVVSIGAVAIMNVGMIVLASTRYCFVRAKSK